MKRKVGTFTKYGLQIFMTAALLALLAAPCAYAVGTASGTDINNRATVSYDVGTVPQEVIESSPTGNSAPGAGNGSDTSFKVDNRVDLTVASSGGTNVTQNEHNAYLTFTVTNTGNTTQGYLLDVVNGATGISMGNIRIYLESNGTPGLQIGTASDDTQYTVGANMGDLDPNGTVGTDDVRTVYVVADAPATVTVGNTDTYWLRATTSDAGTTTVTTQTSGADTTGVDVVFADGDGDGAGANDGDHDGRHIANGVFTVSAATSLQVQKRSAVIYDPINTTTNPKAIPGARMQYTIDINNAGTAAAGSVVLTDTIPTHTKFYVGSVTTNPTGATVEYYNGTVWTYTPTADGDGGDSSVTQLRVTLPGTIAGGGAAQVVFVVVVE